MRDDIIPRACNYFNQSTRLPRLRNPTHFTTHYYSAAQDGAYNVSAHRHLVSNLAVGMLM
jgi:hypothetical protein